MTISSPKLVQKQLEFQILDWNSGCEYQDDEEIFVIRLFGRTEDDHDVCLKIINFTPFFYVKVPDEWGRKEADLFVAQLKKLMSYRCQNNPKFEYDLSECVDSHHLVKKFDFYEFNNKKKFNFVMLKFTNITAMREFSNMLANPIKLFAFANKAVLYRRYESNIEPQIRFMHIRNISACGWIVVSQSNLVHIGEYSNCDYTFETDWHNVSPSSNENRMAPMKILGYDIECITCDHNFPQADRKSDKIIQIGMTMYRYGSMECSQQIMLCMKGCAPISNTIIECYKTERGLIRGWAKKIAELRADFVVGYNNVGFDDEYIYKRIMRIDRESAAKAGLSSVDELENKFIDEILITLGKLNNRWLLDQSMIRESTTKYIVKNLSSASMGDNLLKFFEMPGIITLDMMKIIRREHTLTGYKLDDVSATFITESVDAIKQTTRPVNGKLSLVISTKSTKALEIESYIQIIVIDGYSSSPLREKSKYLVTKIESGFNGKKPCQNITVEIPEYDLKLIQDAVDDPLLKVQWSFAKDDMHHTLINEYFKCGDKRMGDPDKIAQVAKYCIKDCKLVNLLMAKLETIVNFTGMSKVCHVPISYLFLRGQGVKIFSLVSKKCREKNFVIPTLVVNNVDVEGNLEESYEGATVITPEPGVYVKPIGVLDYNALYPKSMCEKNLTHECLVTNEKYENIPGYIYHDIFISNKRKGKLVYNMDGSVKKTHYKFAQEIVPDSQVKAEFAEIFGLLETKHKASVKNIKTGHTISYIQYKLFIDWCNLERIKAIHAVNTDKSMGKSKAKSLISQYERTCRKLLRSFLVYEEELKIIEKRTSSEIDAINKDNKCTEKKTAIDAVNTAANAEYDAILSQLDLNSAQIDALIKIENERLVHAKNTEICKKYNICEGRVVKYGILPEILTELLTNRKAMVAQMNAELDSFKKAIYNSVQLALKITANSLYGQTGSSFSPIKCIAIAASTTCIGRARLYLARDIVESYFPGSKIVYGDTDSIFIMFNLVDENGADRTDVSALVETIQLCKYAASIINSVVPNPQCIVYEKTFHPFILVAKKKYVGLYFEEEPVSNYIKSMGIVLKRRDNAPIVKIIVGGIVDYILKKRDIDGAVEYTRQVIQKLLDGHYSMDKFIISKTLRGWYKNPTSIAHKVLADRMGQRDPGNKPQANDRIPFIYIVKDMTGLDKKSVLQGDLIEHPDYIVENNLKIDYLYYLEHQIMNPTTQFLELSIVLKDITKMFNDFIVSEQNKRLGRQTLDKWIHPISDSKSKTKSNSKSAKSKKKSTAMTKRTPLTETKSKLCFVGNTKKLQCKSIDQWVKYSKKTK